MNVEITAQRYHLEDRQWSYKGTQLFTFVTSMGGEHTALLERCSRKLLERLSTDDVQFRLLTVNIQSFPTVSVTKLYSQISSPFLKEARLKVSLDQRIKKDRDWEIEQLAKVKAQEERIATIQKNLKIAEEIEHKDRLRQEIRDIKQRTLRRKQKVYQTITKRTKNRPLREVNREYAKAKRVASVPRPDVDPFIREYQCLEFKINPES